MRRTASGRGMGGLLEARPEKSTQEFAPRGVAMRKRRMARLILRSSDNAMVSLCRNKISDPGWLANSRDAWCPRWTRVTVWTWPRFEVFSSCLGALAHSLEPLRAPKGLVSTATMLQDGQLNRGGSASRRRTAGQDRARQERLVDERREVASKHSAKLRAMPRRTWMNRDF